MLDQAMCHARERHRKAIVTRQLQRTCTAALTRMRRRRRRQLAIHVAYERRRVRQVLRRQRQETRHVTSGARLQQVRAQTVEDVGDE